MNNLKNKVVNSIQNLNLCLHNKVVLTEAATGPYSMTAIIAALAGAEVYAFARDSKYGTIPEVFSFMKNMIDKFGKLNIHLIDMLTPEIISKVDIITNSGHLRPLNKKKLQYAKEGVVIPLMYESWELRLNDIDINYCKLRNIPVGAINERHPDVDTFNYLGDMAIKLILDSGLCLYNNKFVLVSNNDFGPYIAKTLSKVCLRLGVIDETENKQKYGSDVDWLCDFPHLNIPDEYYDSAAIILSAYPFNHLWIGVDNEIKISDLKAKSRCPVILRYAGDIDTAALQKEGVGFYPLQVNSGHMGILPSDIGYGPVVRLQAGSLKVAQGLIEKENYYNGYLLVQIV